MYKNRYRFSLVSLWIQQIMFTIELISFFLLLIAQKSFCDSLQTQILEARQLYPFRAYKDVQFFHYTVPSQVSFASFQYKANGSVHCPIKKIAVYLQYGSYPVMSLQNAMYPDHFAIQRQFLHNITLFSDTVPVLINITNPLPGNWYAAAFLIENTDRIAQKGLFTPCFSWLSSIVKCHVSENIMSILQTTEITQKIKELQTYRFYGSKNSWLTRIYLKNCSQQNNNCSAIITARPHAIPFSDETSEYFLNCSLSDICLLEMIPAVDNWNYFTILSLESDLEFSLVVETEDCNITIFTGDSDASNSTEWGNSTSGIEDIILVNEETVNGTSEGIVNNTSEGTCWPKIPLVRISLPTNLAFEYNLPSDEDDGYPFILNITNSVYTFTSFKVLPIVDIGGTLVIELALSPFMNYTHINVSVFGCLTYGVRSAPEDIDCIKGIPLSVNTSKREHSLTTLFVPYPEAGMWYLRLQSQCHSFQLGNSSFLSLACDHDKTAIFLRIRSTPCILGQCGAHGTCYQYISGGLIFSTCNCLAGWKGWGCTDNSTARRDSELMLDVLLLTLSNLLFIPAIILSIYRKYYTEAFVYFATMVSSSFYHACDAEVYSYCLIRINVLQFCDFYSAILSVWITLIAMAKLPNSLQSFVHMTGAVGVALGVEYDRTGLWVFVLPTGIGIAILFTSWVIRCYKKKLCYPQRQVWLFYLLPGALLAMIGLSIYAFFETKDNYSYVHSSWHAAIALSILFLLPKKKPSVKSTPEPTISCSYVRVADVSCPDISNPLGTPYSQLLAPSP